VRYIQNTTPKNSNQTIFGLVNAIKKLFVNNARGYKIVLKPFAPEQTWLAMIGYITKDKGKASYSIQTHNVTAQELAQGRRDHQALKTTFFEDKKVNVSF